MGKCRVPGIRHHGLHDMPGYVHQGAPQADVSSPHAWTAFFDIALWTLAATDPSLHFRMPTSRADSALVFDIGYADDLVSLSTSLAGLRHKADLMSAFALLFDLAISAPKLRAVCLGPAPPHTTLTIHGWTPTVIPVRTQGSLTILGLTIDLSSAQVTQQRSTHAHLTKPLLFSATSGWWTRLLWWHR